MTLDPRVVQALQLLRSAVEQAEDVAAAAPSWLEATPGAELASATDLLTMWLPELRGAAGSPWDALFAGLEVAAAPAHPAPALADDALAVEAADAAVDCLFAFVHALGRHDVDAAMACVSPHFHAIDPERGELDRACLRRRLERALDHPQRRDLEVALARVPEAVAHPAGVLIHDTLEIDARLADGTPTATQRWDAVFLLCPDSDGAWRIHAIADMERT